MAYSHTLDLVQGDTNPQLTITLRDANTAAAGRTLDEGDPTTWAIVNITGGTVRLKVRALGSDTVKDTIDGLITDGPNGRVLFLFSETTLDTAGTLEAEIEYTDSDERIQTVPDLIKIKVREQF